MKILLVCSNGMSTSLISSRMKKYADTLGISIEIKAIAVDHVRKYAEGVDIILLAPQIAFYKEEISKYFICDVCLITPLHYGRCDGEAILKDILDNR